MWQGVWKLVTSTHTGQVIDILHKSHSALNKYPTMYDFVTEMCTHAHFCYKMVYCGIQVHCGICATHLFNKLSHGISSSCKSTHLKISGYETEHILQPRVLHGGHVFCVDAMMDIVVVTLENIYDHIDSLWLGEDICHHGSRSSQVKVMTCCQMAASHYLNQCWFIMNGVLWHSPVGISVGNRQDISY